LKIGRKRFENFLGFRHPRGVDAMRAPVDGTFGGRTGERALGDFKLSEFCGIEQENASIGFNVTPIRGERRAERVVTRRARAQCESDIELVANLSGLASDAGRKNAAGVA